MKPARTAEDRPKGVAQRDPSAHRDQLVDEEQTFLEHLLEDQDLAVRLPTALWPVIHAIPADALTLPGKIDDENAASRIDFFFTGGDTLAGWLETPVSGTAAERTARNGRLFEEAVITYTTQGGGIGFINPATMTRTRVGAALPYPPATAWHANEA